MFPESANIALTTKQRVVIWSTNYLNVQAHSQPSGAPIKIIAPIHVVKLGNRWTDCHETKPLYWRSVSKIYWCFSVLVTSDKNNRYFVWRRRYMRFYWLPERNLPNMCRSKKKFWTKVTEEIETRLVPNKRFGTVSVNVLQEYWKLFCAAPYVEDSSTRFDQIFIEPARSSHQFRATYV